MELYIKSVGMISGAASTESIPRKAVEPDYAGLIAPMQLRRMSKAVRIGIGASKAAMKEAGIERPDAISVGTAMGCLNDTEHFLGKMVEQDEQMLTPTSFIQSTHNTVSGQIALLAGCHGHNLTFVQRGHSFEHAMLNAQLYLNEHKGEQVLVGGIDELTDNSLRVMETAGVYSDTNPAGEGAAFFVVSDSAVDSKLCIKDISCFTTKDAATASEKIQTFLQRNNLAAGDIELLIVGESGDARSLPFYDILKQQFDLARTKSFKQDCGEYATASSYALGLLTQRVQSKEITAKNILLVNNYLHYGSCWLLKVM
jgi:hypothetical protein